MSVDRRLAEILDDYTAILDEIERRTPVAGATRNSRVLQPADRQCGCTSPAIAHADHSAGRRRRGWLV